MIEVYASDSIEGLKVLITLEELGLVYHQNRLEDFPADILGNDVAMLPPGSNMPAIVVDDSARDQLLSLSGANAILLDLAERVRELLPEKLNARSQVRAWLMNRMISAGPKLSPEQVRAHCAALDQQLEGRDWLVDDYSLADIANWSWLAKQEGRAALLKRHANVRAWFERVDQRPAIARALGALDWSAAA